MNTRAEDYSILVGLDPVSNEYVAIVCEFPGFSWVAATKERAIAGARALLTDILADMIAEGEAVPAPATPHLIPA